MFLNIKNRIAACKHESKKNAGFTLIINAKQLICFERTHLKPSSYIPSLTGIRAIAAFLVFFHHFNQADYPYPIFRVLNELHIGVTIFFVLSGFLICFRYYHHVAISGSWFRKYIKNRIARIYPMYALLTIATFVYAYVSGNDAAYHDFEPKSVLIGMNLLFVRGFFDDLKFTGVGQGWSLTVEECFYLSAPFFFVLLKRWRGYWWLLPLCIVGFGIALVAFFSQFNWWGFYGNYRFMFLYTFTGRCIEFFVGMALAKVLLDRPLPKRLGTCGFTLLGAFGVLLCIGLLSLLPINSSIPFGLHQPAGIAINNVLLPLAICVLFYGLITEASLFQQLLATPFMQILGKSSYIFYLLHIGFLATMSHDWLLLVQEQILDVLSNNDYPEWISLIVGNATLAIVLVFVWLNICSYLLWRFIEEPMNLYIRKLTFKTANHTAK